MHRNPPSCTIHSCVPKSTPSNTSACVSNSSAPSNAQRQACEALSCDFVASAASAADSVTAATCGAAGGEFTPQACMPFLSPLNWAFPSAGTKNISGANVNLARFDGALE